MYNHNFMRFKTIAKTVSQLLFVMSDLWETMQECDSEPPCIKYNNKYYPLDNCFYEFCYAFKSWIDTFEEGGK